MDALNKAIDTLRPSVPEIAIGLGLTPAALYRYRNGTREVPGDLTSRLAAYVEGRITALEALRRPLKRRQP